MSRAGGRSLRVRLLVVTLAVVAAGLGLGGLALYGGLTLALFRTMDTTALASAREVAALADAGRLPAVVPISGAQVVQVVDAQGRVVSASVTADRLTPLLRPAELERALDGDAVTVSGARIGTTGPLRVSAIRAGLPDNPLRVLVAVPLRDVLASRSLLRTALLVALPLLLLGLGLVAWRLIGGVLRPVETLRRDAERISGSTAAERLPVPSAADEIRALAVTLNAMLDRLAGARERQRGFVADAAHELRSPLTSLRVQLEVAQRLGEGGELPADLLPEVDRLSRLVEDLLLLARADADQRGPSSPRDLDARALIADLAASHADARVPVHAAEGEPALVTADPEELRRALANLVDNAVRHAGSGVWLDVTSDRRDGRNEVVLGVTDDGPGIPTEDRERVFDRFARRDDARTSDAGGSGLGLPIARELIHRAGGSVAFTTDPTGRLRGEVRLPVGGDGSP